MTTPIVPGGSRFPNPEPWSGDPAYLTEQAAGILHLPVSDPDMLRLGRLAYVVRDTVRTWLDWRLPFDDINQTEPIPDPVTDACIAVLVEWYRRKDAPFGIVGSWAPDGTAIRVSRDWLDPVRASLEQFKQRYGVA